jgi:hypothetical protein
MLASVASLSPLRNQERYGRDFVVPWDESGFTGCEVRKGLRYVWNL